MKLQFIYKKDDKFAISNGESDVAECFHESDAAIIFNRVNVHDELVKELEFMLGLHDNVQSVVCYKNTRAVLAKAKRVK